MVSGPLVSRCLGQKYALHTDEQVRVIPAEAYTADISDYEFRLYAVLCHTAGQEGVVEASVAHLGTLTRGASDKTVRRALKALEAAGLVETARTRSTGGKWGITKYVLPAVKNDRRSTPQPPVKNDRTEVVDSKLEAAVELTSSDLLPSLSRQVSNGGTTYPYGQSPCPIRRVVLKKFDDGDDNIGGFGLLEPKPLPEIKIRKSDPKTRGRRPQHEWTPLDVAAEFQFRVGKRFYWLPGTLNIRSLAGALSKNRSQYGVTALIELELLDMFMADERNFLNVGNEAPDLYKSFLRMFKTKMNQARENIGLKPLSAVEVVESAPMLVASDGQTFDNSAAGRSMLEKYERRIANGAR
jgi:DNA-binding transcriptional ArsR family regulator